MPGGTEHPIRVLHLEDSTLDAELIREALTADGLNCEIVQVDGKESFEWAVTHESFDLILSDYNIWDYDGKSAVKLAREKQPDAPVIVISGQIGEDDAVKCLQLGATDYLLKQRLERLPSAVKHALEEAAQRKHAQQAEEKLRESEERFRQLAENIDEVFWLTDVEMNQMIYISPAYETIWGRTCASLYESPLQWLDAIHPEDRERVLHAALSKQITGDYQEEYRIVRPDGTIRWIHDRAFPVKGQSGEVYRIAGVACDITERKQFDAQTLRTQRLESIGTLVGGIAHDLNNMLTPILIATELLRLEFPDSASKYLAVMHDSTKRGADMVRQLLTFARGAEGDRSLVRPVRLLEEIAKLIHCSFPKSIELVTRHATELPAIAGDATQLHQVLLNLCVNARDAMPGGGTLRLEAEAFECDESFARLVPEAKPGGHVVIKVTDTGTGIPTGILDHIFDPFFTTKGPDKGTGLGLSTVIGIIKGHGGFVRVKSTPEQGTCFEVYLPASTAVPDLAEDLPSTTSFRGNGRLVLVVDDEPIIRKMLKSTLEKLDFKVLLAGDGTEAMLQFVEHREQLMLIITDLNMPHMDGLALAGILRRMVPDGPIIAMTGESDVSKVEALRNLGIAHVLNKPFHIAKLIEVLEHSLS